VSIAYQVVGEGTSASISGRAYTPARWSSSATRWKESRSTSAPGSRRRPDPEVLVSSIVRDLAAGSGMDFEDRGSAELKGVPGEWPLYAPRLSDRVRVG
jgi:hypothetical protein